MKSNSNPSIGDTYNIYSRYGQKFNITQIMNNEIDSLTSQKRKELKDKGYDVDTYDEKFNKLDKEVSDKISGVNIWEREKITLEYNKKKNRLAKRYLGIDLHLKV